MLQQMIDELPREVPLSISRVYSDKKHLVPLWVVEIGSKKETHADVIMAFSKAKERWENGTNSK